MPNILVTGGAGFIGSHVADRFLAAGYAVTVLDDLSTGSRRNVPKGAKLRVLDVAGRAAATLVRKGRFDVIAHLAAQIDVRKSVEDPAHDATVNVLGALNLLEAVRALAPERRPRFVFASTGGALYGDATRLPTHESAPTNPDAPYGIAKLSTEYYLAYYARTWRLDTYALRFGNVYGPRQNLRGEAGVIAMFTWRLLEGQPLTVYGTGKQTRDYVYVGDVADAFFVAATRAAPAAGPVEARAFNIGTGVETSVLELVDRLCAITGKPRDVRFAPARPGEAERSLLDPSKARSVLGWRAAVALDEGLAKTVAWASTPPKRAGVPAKKRRPPRRK